VKNGGNFVTTIHELIEDWIAMRSTLQQQLKLLESGKMGAGTNVSGVSTESTIIRLKKFIDELNGLLREYASADRSQTN
jgi:hypothetical protein